MQKRNFRPSKLESLESFLLHIQTIGELNTKIEERKSKALLNKIGLQPFMAKWCDGQFYSAEVIVQHAKKYILNELKHNLECNLPIVVLSSDVNNSSYRYDLEDVYSSTNSLLKYETDFDTDYGPSKSELNDRFLIENTETTINKEPNILKVGQHVEVDCSLTNCLLEPVTVLDTTDVYTPCNSELEPSLLIKNTETAISKEPNIVEVHILKDVEIVLIDQEANGSHFDADSWIESQCISTLNEISNLNEMSDEPNQSEDSDVSSDSDSEEYTPKPKTKRKHIEGLSRVCGAKGPWTKPEKMAVIKNFEEYIKEDRLPSMDQLLLKLAPLVELKNRSPTSVRSWIHNELQRRRSNVIMSDQPGPSKRIKFSDSNFEDTVMRWYNEIDEDASDVGSGDENIVSDHDSCSEEGLSISGEIDAEEQELEDCIEEKKNKNSTAVNKSPAKVFYVASAITQVDVCIPGTVAVKEHLLSVEEEYLKLDSDLHTSSTSFFHKHFTSPTRLKGIEVSSNSNSEIQENTITKKSFAISPAARTINNGPVLVKTVSTVTGQNTKRYFCIYCKQLVCNYLNISISSSE
ncbi:hypothetical protein RN001_005603 [Aquatica leii]|uniref:Uncharacterized protein n=1 Tax=Aquatica leii TaxID=1421715 RepID=A0AAN7SIY9_9COLE|nr:hypothetical protein RN001_005603 [Aquatica leii]